MCCKGFMKRVLPFFLAFSLGLFIASFFVTIAAPNFKFNRGWRRHQQYDQKMEFENQRLREENSRLKRQLAENDTQDVFYLGSDRNFDEPPPLTKPMPHRR